MLQEKQINILQKKTDKCYPENINWPVIEQSLWTEDFPDGSFSERRSIDKALRFFYRKVEIIWIKMNKSYRGQGVTVWFQPGPSQ